MPVIARLLREVKTRYLQSISARRLYLKRGRAIASFTFDDVPRSALTNGVPILNEAGIKATFYVALGLSAGEGCAEPEGEGYLTWDDIRLLHGQGHHIACHTYSHYRLSAGSVEELVADARRNSALLEELLDAGPVRHFSYPYGEVNFRLKRKLSIDYDSLRSSRPGINLGTTDLNLLRATSIYNPRFSRASMQKIIDRAAGLGGWLIFYTHGVDSMPDDYSCTPGQLAWVIERCKHRDMAILPVSTAYNLLKK